MTIDLHNNQGTECSFEARRSSIGSSRSGSLHELMGDMAHQEVFENAAKVQRVDSKDELTTQMCQAMVLAKASDHQHSCTEVIRFAFTIPIGIFFLCLGLAIAIIGIVLAITGESAWKNDFRAQVRTDAQPFADALKVVVKITTSSAYALGAFVGTDSAMAAHILKDTGNFNELAQVLIDKFGGIGNLQLARCGIVTRIHPLPGNEAAIGLNLLKDPDQVQASLANNILNKKLTFVGPFTLVHGGLAILGRYPVFSDGDNYVCTSNFHGVDGVPSNFWGYATVLTTMEDLFAPLHFEESIYEKAGLDYEVTALWKGKTTFLVCSKGEGGLDADTEDIDVTLTDAQGSFVFSIWKLRVKPKDGWPIISDLLLLRVGIIVISFLSGFRSWYRLMQSKASQCKVRQAREYLIESLHSRYNRLVANSEEKNLDFANHSAVPAATVATI